MKRLIYYNGVPLRDYKFGFMRDYPSLTYGDKVFKVRPRIRTFGEFKIPGYDLIIDILSKGNWHDYGNQASSKNYKIVMLTKKCPDGIYRPVLPSEFIKQFGIATIQGCTYVTCSEFTSTMVRC